MTDFCLNDFNEYISIKNLIEKDVDMDTDLSHYCDERKPYVIRINDSFNLDEPFI